MAKMMRVVVCVPDKEAYITEIPNDYNYLRKILDGPIECTYPFTEKVGIICNDEGKLRGMRLNREIRYEGTDYRDIIAGTFLIVGLTRDNFGSLTPAQAEKYRKIFECPEVFMKLGETIVAVPMSRSVREEIEKIKSGRPASAVNEDMKYGDDKPFGKR